jgi:hypothetical protein
VNWKKLLAIALFVVIIISTTYVMFVPGPIQDCNHLPSLTPALTSDQDINFGFLICIFSNWMVTYPILRIAGGLLWDLLGGFMFWSILVDPVEKKEVEDAK